MVVYLFFNISVPESAWPALVYQD